MRRVFIFFIYTSKKKITRFIFLLFMWILAHINSEKLNAQTSSDYFVLTFYTDLPFTCNTCITVFTSPSYTYNYDVDVDNDGIFDFTGLTGDFTHDYGSIGTYTIQIRGDFPSIYFNGGWEGQKLTDIVQWGTINWSSFASSFNECTNMTCSATDVPDLSGVTDFSGMFARCGLFNANIGGWNTSTITNMENMFLDASSFNQNIGGWNTSNVTTMVLMFSGASAFNQNIGGWNIANVDNMTSMFSGASAFNQNIGGWNTSNVTTLIGMFENASAFNQNIGAWNVSNVTNMSGMFTGASSFNQNLNAWDVQNVTNMATMFSNASSFNQHLGNWTLNNSVDLQFLLSNCGMNCINYSKTLYEWSINPSTPFSRSLDADNLSYGTNAIGARNDLIGMSWTISGDASSGSDCIALPIELISFEGNCKNNDLTLYWKTASEKNNDFFTIERAADTLNWEVIGTKQGAGNSNEILSYDFIDQNPLEKAYYRLKQTDINGDFEYSHLIFVKCKPEKSLDVKLFPNPSSGLFTVENDDIGQKLELFNQMGQLIYKIIITSKQTILNLTYLPKGVYYIQQSNNYNSYREKLVIEFFSKLQNIF